MGSDKPDRSLFTYDDRGKASEEIWYDSADQLKGKTIFTYDTRGNLIEEKSSNGIRIIYSYDSHNNKTSQRVLDIAKDEGPRMFGPVEKTVRYSYDRRNHLIEVASYNPNGSRVWNPALQAHRIVYAYNSKGQIKSQIVFNAGNGIRTSTRYIYDSLGRVAKEALFTSKDGITRVFKYTYRADATGNWIAQFKKKQAARIGKRNYVPVEAVYRSIEYY
jgi:YD repeat-containing protein